MLEGAPIGLAVVDLDRWQLGDVVPKVLEGQHRDGGEEIYDGGDLSTGVELCQPQRQVPAH